MTNTYTEQNNSQSKNFITITLRLQLVIPTNSKDGRATDAHTNQFTSRRRGAFAFHAKFMYAEDPRKSLNQ